MMTRHPTRGDGAHLVWAALVMLILPTQAAASPGLSDSAPHLTPDTVPDYTLPPVPVVGSRASSTLPLSTRGVEILSREELDRLPASTVAEALRGAMGVEVSSRSPAQTDLQLRGGTFEQVLVLVDGVRVSDAQTGHFDLNLTVPLDQVERIEILRGPGSAQYGSDALGGVINIVTRDARPGDRGARLEGGSFGTGILALRQSASLPRGVLARGAFEVGQSDGHRPGTEWEQELLSFDVIAPMAGGRFSAQAGMAWRDFGADDFYAPFPSVEATEARTLRVGWAPDADRRIQVQPGLHWRRHKDDFILIRDRPEVYRNLHASVQRGADVAVRIPLGSALIGALGGEWAEHALTSSALGDHTETHQGLFAELSGSLSPRLDVSLGLRHDDVGNWGGVTSPSAAASYALTSFMRVRGSWGRAFRAPTWTERFYADPGHTPNPDLAPERGRALELGLQSDPDAAVVWSIAGFERSTRGLIDWARPLTLGDATPAPWVPRNVGYARFRGLEGEARWGWAPRHWVGVRWMTLSVRSDTPDGLESKYALRPLVRQAGVHASQGLPAGWSLNLNALHGRRGGPGLAQPQDGFWELDARIQHDRGWRGLVPWIDLKNLSGSTHLDLTGNPVAGRRWTLGVRTDPGL